MALQTQNETDATVKCNWRTLQSSSSTPSSPNLVELFLQQKSKLHRNTIIILVICTTHFLLIFMCQIIYRAANTVDDLSISNTIG